MRHPGDPGGSLHGAKHILETQDIGERAMADFPPNILVCVLGLVAGLVFGATAQLTNFCTMGAVSDMVNLQDYRRFRAWLLAIAVAIAGSQSLHLLGIVDLGKSIYLGPNLGWL